MKKRIITGIILFLILVPVLYLGGYVMLALTMLLSYTAGFELIRMFSKKHPGMHKYRYLLPVYSAILVFTNYFVVTKQLEISFLFLLMILSVLCILIIVLKDKSLEMSCAGLFILVLIYGGLFFGTATSLRYITNVGSVSGKYIGLWLMLYLAITTMCTDMGAYTVGSLIGKHKLCPLISPNKTVEGAVGGSLIGAIFGTVTLLIVEHYYEFTFFKVDNIILNSLLIFLVSILITIIGQIGDLVASKLKREYEIKDYSNLFPGHGGVMDRFDSLIMTGTFFYLVCLYSGLF